MRALRLLAVLGVTLALAGCGIGAQTVDFRTDAGQKQAVAALTTATGGSTFALVDFFSNHVTAVAPSKPGATSYDDWYYRGGRATSVAPEQDQPDASALFDVTKLDLSKIEPAMQKTLKLTGMTLNKDSYIVVQRFSAEGVPVTAPMIEVLLDDGYKQAYVMYDFDLNITQKTGSFFETG
ncbi:MAG TPA: hypothetical protein VGM70_04820 [Pseudolysinimonas sp.]